MNPKSYLVLTGPTSTQEKNNIGSSNVELFSDYESAVAYLEKEAQRQKRGAGLWVRLQECEHLHDEDGRWYDDKESVLMTVYA